MQSACWGSFACCIHSFLARLAMAPAFDADPTLWWALLVFARVREKLFHTVVNGTSEGRDAGKLSSHGLLEHGLACSSGSLDVFLWAIAGTGQVPH